MKKSKKLDVIFLLDRSGSMSNCVNDTIGGYNNYLKEQKKNSNSLITTILFDNEYEVLYDRVPVNEVKKLTNKEYYVRGCTALMDAIGKTINTMSPKVSDKVLFIITTDGLENASKEYRKSDIKKLIKKHNNWEFLFIGANIDSYEEGASIGISKKNIANYTQSKEGVSKMFRSISKASCQVMCEDQLDSSWKEELDKYENTLYKKRNQ